MGKRILIVHGWMHSADLYKKLKTDLEKNGSCIVKLYEIPGFGDKPAKRKHKLIDYYTKSMEKELAGGSYDYAIGHSMGGTILLRAMAGKEMDTKLILLSPEYGGITVLKPLTLFVPLMPPILYLFKKANNSAVNFFIKCMALFTINRWEKIDDQIVADTKKADPMVAAHAMIELAWDHWRLKKGEWKCGKVELILGEKDRLIKGKKMKRLYSDIGDCHGYVIRGIGHTAVLEAYDRLLKILLKILGGISFDSCQNRRSKSKEDSHESIRGTSKRN